MRTTTTLAAAALLLLAATSCGSDEPKEEIWYAEIPLVFHVGDTESQTLASCKRGAVYGELNTTTMTASITCSLTLGDEELYFDITNATLERPATGNGLVAKVTTPTRAGGHLVDDMAIYFDMRQSGNARHYFTASFDAGRYTVNGLLQEMSFEVNQSTIERNNGYVTRPANGLYKFTISKLNNLAAGLADFEVSGLDTYPLDNGIHYQGFTLEPTYTGYHITGSEVRPQEGGSSTLTTLTADIDVSRRTFTATYAIENCGTVTATGDMF